MSSHVGLISSSRSTGFSPRLLVAAPGQWVVKGGYANELRRPDDARFTDDLDLKIDAAIETAPELLASGFAVDLGDDFSYEVATSAAPLEGPPGGGLRFVVVARLAGTELVRFKVDISAADIVVGDFEFYLSDPVVQRLGFRRSRFPVYPINQHFAEKLHALTLARAVENTRARDIVDLVWFVHHFTFRSDALAIPCIATFERRATHAWPPVIDVPPNSWTRPFQVWRAELDLAEPTPAAAASAVRSLLEPVYFASQACRGIRRSRRGVGPSPNVLSMGGTPRRPRSTGREQYRDECPPSHPSSTGQHDRASG